MTTEKGPRTTSATTPRPWHRHVENCCGVIFGPISDGSPLIADVFAAPTRAADATLIVAAVNAYDRLRAIEAAAREVTSEWFKWAPPRAAEFIEDPISALRAAIQAEETTP